MKIDDIKFPKDIKSLSVSELNDLCKQIRNFIINNVSKTGGHLSSNLGVVELTVALHYVFDAPKDKLIFDVGHQCYTHKILTGRARLFPTLRKYNGLSGFQKKNESKYDCWEAGHSSTSLSAALGMAYDRDLSDEKYEIIPIIGDGSISNGMAFEALNNIGESNKKIIIVLNDNGMSISKNHGALNNILTKMRISGSYLFFKSTLNKIDQKIPQMQKFNNKLRKFRDNLKQKLIKNNIFTNFGIDYLGPIDGHDLQSLLSAFEACKKHRNKPILIHVVTTKGKGYEPCEKDTEGNWHSVSYFDIKTGSLPKTKDPSYSTVVANKLTMMAQNDDRIVVITPAMTNGSSLQSFARNFPERFIDAGISEEHAATFAAGIANQHHYKPYYIVYSTFAQRCYDQINHDIARMDLPVRILLDRSGIVGADGPTHHGVFDISIFNSLPNMTICQGSSLEETYQLLEFSQNFDHPFILRYPKGTVDLQNTIKVERIVYGKWSIYPATNRKPRFAIITYGNDVYEVYTRLKEENLLGIVINARFIKPIDEEMLDYVFSLHIPVFVFTGDAIRGGLIDSILEFANNRRNSPRILQYGISDNFLPQGSIEQLRKDEGCDIDTLIEDIEHIVDEAR